MNENKEQTKTNKERQTCNCIASAGQSRHMSGEMQGLLQMRCPHSRSCEFIRCEGLKMSARTRSKSSHNSDVSILRRSTVQMQSALHKEPEPFQTAFRLWKGCIYDLRAYPRILAIRFPDLAAMTPHQCQIAVTVVCTNGGGFLQARSLFLVWGAKTAVCQTVTLLAPGAGIS